MKSAGWYIRHEGRALWAATKREAHKLALAIADKTGKPVTVRAAKVAPAAKARTMKKNPMTLGGFGAPAGTQWQADEAARKRRADYMKATKARRLAKGLRGADRGGKVKAAERGAAKSGKFAVLATRRNERFELVRASRRAALDLAEQFDAEGWKTTVREL